MALGQVGEVNIIKNIICAIVGHEWKYLRFGPRFEARLHTTMHSDCDCTRCGKQIRDAARGETT